MLVFYSQMPFHVHCHLCGKMGGQHVSIGQIRTLSLREAKINVRGHAVPSDKIGTEAQLSDSLSLWLLVLHLSKIMQSS